MGGAYSVLCPTQHLGTVPFRWTASVTSTHPTSGSRDHLDAAEHGHEDAETPETVMAATSRDQSISEDYARTHDNPTWKVRSSDADKPLSVSDDESRDVMTSQPPEPKIATGSSVGRRRRFRDTALTITSEIHELEHSELAVDRGTSVQLGSTSKQRLDDVSPRRNNALMMCLHVETTF